ncbi:hypothetical protein [Paraflavitalea speifideaquila]|uniref:hypothetical protein n=1 Tax=Paraflavitalea speifideaquila TaxID=3076558 RepID=UPI003CCE1357
MGWENAIVRNAPFKEDQEDNPFAIQQYLVYELKEHILYNGPLEEVRSLLQHIRQVFDKGLEVVQFIRDQSVEKGASLSQTFILLQLEQKLERMQLVLEIVDEDQLMNTSHLATLFIKVVRDENRKNSIREFLSQTTGTLAYQIAEQKTKKATSILLPHHWNIGK